MEKALKFLLWTLGIFVGLCAFGRVFFFETWTIPNDPHLGASVAPTLGPGDLVLVLTRGGAVFGDLVRCPDPDDNARYVVGRISGLSGDNIELQSRSLRVNGTRYDSTDACTKPTVSVPNPETGTPVEMQCARVDMGGGWHYRVTALKHIPSNDHNKQVGPGKVYLLSDNRDMHEDSRDFGTIDEANCQQRVFFRLWGGNGWTDAEHRLNFIR